MAGHPDRTDATSWLDSGFFEGQLFRLSTFGASTFKIDLITGSTPGHPRPPGHQRPGDRQRGPQRRQAHHERHRDHDRHAVGGGGDLVASLDPNNPTAGTADWYLAKTVNVLADPGFDIQPGHELPLLPKSAPSSTGLPPLAVEGSATSTDRSLRPAIMLPGENNGPFFNIAPQPPESMSIDTLNIYDDGSRQNLTGTLTSTALSGLNMGTTLDFRDPSTPCDRAVRRAGVLPGGVIEKLKNSDG